LQQFRPAQKSH